ncbi:translation initiation factor IF-3, partial [candidate division WWE3 bacterium CG_4_9_14_3_um_filter_34_6]
MAQQRINNQIGATEVRLIDQSGENVGVKPTSEAIKMAKDLGLDLIEVSRGATPPVCKLVDYNKFLFEQKSKLKKTKTKKA